MKLKKRKNWKTIELKKILIDEMYDKNKRKLKFYKYEKQKIWKKFVKMKNIKRESIQNEKKLNIMQNVKTGF